MVACRPTRNDQERSMATYRMIYEARTTFDRGTVVQRFYDKLSADLIMHNYIRTQVRALKIRRKPLLSPLRRKYKRPLVRRAQEE
jgi:hypothetical protein